ncbi:MAG: M6 family metalloprotease domain-containing protein [Candidatus Cloacimonetes bacterium]|nr:M6 family metalloprotease domain-containing protein [Candidatus Cloacimonadota bacterium]
MPCFRFVPKLLLITVLAVLARGIFALVPPVPAYKNPPRAWEATLVESTPFTAEYSTKTMRNIPNNILVLRIQFSDKSFRSVAAHPDSLPHDAVFFDRWMIHLKDFYAEASHGAYELNYTLYPQVLTMPRPISYYGADSDERIDARLPDIIPDFLAQIDDDVNFNQYGGIIIFHAGAGQESDLDGSRTGTIWSTFLTRRRLQAAFDPNNDNYPGLVTNDGAILKNIVIIPEDEFQDYFPIPPDENADGYLFSIYGVLTHQFGHLIGLPTLYDNNSSNGYSQGIGNWGLMGTGVWNGSGYVPAQLSAYSRYLLGWEQPIVLSQNSVNNPVDMFLNHSPDAIRMYKVPISATEYFLLENRQQNPDGSIDPYSNNPSYSFKLLPDGEQEYYQNYPLLPYFDFMTNRYADSEWDFFLPGLGGPIPPGYPSPQDGSGILIWHIDENIIAANFTANFDMNHINADASHKGVDLEEADGTQNMDSSAQDVYKWGSPYDSFRDGNNDYFGNPYHNGLLSLPTSESYYGGIPLEIYDISASGNRMTFSTRFRWSLEAAYLGNNPYSAAAIDLDGNGETELFYPMSNGLIYLWENDEIVSGFPLRKMPIVQNYTWDGNTLYIPMQTATLSRLYAMSAANRIYVFTQNMAHWASHPVDIGDYLALPLNHVDAANPDSYSFSTVYLWDKAAAQTHSGINFQGVIRSNLVDFRDKLSLIYKDSGNQYWLSDINKSNWDITARSIPIPADSVIVGIFKAPILPGSEQGELLVQCRNSLYMFDTNLQLVNGFPFVHNLVAESDSSHYAPLSIADVDGNGSLDIIIGGDLSYVVLDYHGGRMSPETLSLPNSGDNIAAGVYAMDIDADGKAELVGNFSLNRLCVWENDYRMKSGYPVAFAERSHSMPFTAMDAENNWYLYSSTDNGRVFRSSLANTPLANPALAWNTEYADMLRSASIDPPALPNQYSSTELFVPGQLYIYPNPLKSIYNQKLTLNVMPTRDVSLELSIYDISGSLVYRQDAVAKAYLKNLDIFNIPANKLSSGVYIAVVKTADQSKRIKFSVEK